jgi:hypothetical protein
MKKMQQKDRLHMKININSLFYNQEHANVNSTNFEP